MFADNGVARAIWDDAAPAAALNQEAEQKKIAARFLRGFNPFGSQG